MKWVDTPNDNPTDDKTDDDNMAIFTIGSRSPRPITISLEIDDQLFTMEVDTGAAVSIMPAGVFC